MDELPQTSRWGSLALVSYIPDPLGSFLNGLRHSLTGEDTPHAHVTILPRRPLTVPVDGTSEQVLKLLTGFRAFAVELSVVRRFPQTNVLYVDISEGSARLHALHDALSMGDLAYNEEFEFRPHLTLGCSESSSDMETGYEFAKKAWDSAPAIRRFMLQEIVCLWLRPDGSQNEWGRLWSHNLKTRQTRDTPPATLAATAQTY
jgi:2'-5' RNA ligase